MPRDETTLPEGLYDEPVTEALAEQLERLGASRAEIAALSHQEAPQMLARLLHGRLVHSLGALPAEERLARQVDLVNRILELLREQAREGGALRKDRVAQPGRRLLAVLPEPPGGLGRAVAPERPEIPLGMSDLLVNGPHDLSIGPEIQRELASADRVDLLIAFLKWSGFRLVEPALRAFLARRPQGLRVLTSAYMGATERRAVDALHELGAQIRLCFDPGRTRLHAKAWLFHRETGFSTACIGSSNLSVGALLDGLEWNVRLSEVDNGAILEKFSATFEQYWEDREFEPYDPARDAKRLERALRSERTPTSRLRTALEVTPRPHQEEILEDLAAERAHGHHRNLVVAATGTGKTVVAALDYRRLRRELGGLSLLFVAHRREILEQSLDTFRVVLRDGDFGELLVGGEEPIEGRHVFSSIQSLRADRLSRTEPSAYDMVIVDEFHHAAAPTYERLLTHLRPTYLLGLTATPERADGRSVLAWFDGRMASELRLWKALDQGLLSPFQYFGLSGPDVSGVRWTRGRYDVAELSNVYTADHFFAMRVIQEVEKTVGDVDRMRALGFCVDVAHAEFMAARFAEAGFRAHAVSGTTPAVERDEALRKLQSGALQLLFSVDLFNEGVDLPDVDTLVFLRPTESATLFLQQLGRGLRRSEDKECCTVLDFIGRAHRKFRFDARFRAILGGTRRQIEKGVKRGFPVLPSGCSIMLRRDAEKAVLENLRAQIGSGRSGLVEDLQALGDVDLPTFLRDADVELEDVYGRAGQSFTELRRRAGFDPAEVSSEAASMERSFARMLHLDDAHRLQALRRLLGQVEAPSGDEDDSIQRMLFILLGQRHRPYGEMTNAWRALWGHRFLRVELEALIAVLEDRSRRLSLPLPADFADWPLRVHATYSLDEVMAAIGERTGKGGVKRIQTGVYYLEERVTDLFFVTLEKSEADYSPTTLYRDYPISPTRFHWESQSSCHAGTKTGRRYLKATRGGAQHVLIFVRARKKDARGETLPYVLLGPAYYRRHQGGRPMQIEWDLAHPIPAADFQEMKVAAG